MANTKKIKSYSLHVIIIIVIIIHLCLHGIPCAEALRAFESILKLAGRNFWNYQQRQIKICRHL